MKLEPSLMRLAMRELDFLCFQINGCSEFKSGVGGREAGEAIKE